MNMLIEAVPALVIVGGFLFTLALGGLVADYIFPRIKPLERFLDTLPMDGR